MSKTAFILGCGPAGLLAAHAFHQEGWEVTIFSRKVKSEITGAMFLHASILGITGKLFTINFEKRGDRDGYARNVYGDIDADVSWDKFSDGPYPAWSLQEAYDVLWDLYSGRIRDLDIGPDTNVTALACASDVLVSTIPKTYMCESDSHSFPAQKIWLTDSAPLSVREDTIVYNGNTSEPWYRSSRIKGIPSTESRFSIFGAKRGFKPIKTNCDCRPEIVFLGRFGEWNKQVLLHQVYEKAQRIAVERMYTNAV